MPKTIELCFYEAGLRLGQFAILFATTTQRGGSNDLRFDQVSTSIDALRDAFERIEGSGSGPDPRGVKESNQELPGTP